MPWLTTSSAASLIKGLNRLVVLLFQVEGKTNAEPRLWCVPVIGVLLDQPAIQQSGIRQVRLLCQECRLGTEKQHLRTERVFRCAVARKETVRAFASQGVLFLMQGRVRRPVQGLEHEWALAVRVSEFRKQPRDLRLPVRNL